MKYEFKGTGTVMYTVCQNSETKKGERMWKNWFEFEFASRKGSSYREFELPGVENKWPERRKNDDALHFYSYNVHINLGWATNAFNKICIYC